LPIVLVDETLNGRRGEDAVELIAHPPGVSMYVNMVPNVAPGQSAPALIIGKVPLPVLDCTPLFSGAPLDQTSALRLAAILKVLGEPARLRLLRERRDNWVYYRAVPGALDGVLEALGGRSHAPVGSSAACDDDCRCS
jgi:hypothetical protein